MLDSLRDGVLFFDLRGRLLAANRSAAQLLPAREARCWAALQDFVDSVCDEVRRRRPEGVEPLGEAELASGEGEVRVQATYIEPDLFGGGPTLLVVSERRLEPELGEAELRERFGLSRQEYRVARLLVEGRSNGEIARLLCISPHTARHHTEHILSKLNLRSRAEVAAAVLRR